MPEDVSRLQANRPERHRASLFSERKKLKSLRQARKNSARRRSSVSTSDGQDKPAYGGEEKINRSSYQKNLY
jgi:hypothetical protein